MYNRFFLNLKKDCKDYLNSHLQNAGRFKCSRVTDFNSFYIKYCQERFGGKNEPEMFCNLEKLISNFIDTHKEAKTGYQVRDYNSADEIRVHQRVYVLVDNAQFLYFFSLLFPYHCSS